MVEENKEVGLVQINRFLIVFNTMFTDHSQNTSLRRHLNAPNTFCTRLLTVSAIWLFVSRILEIPKSPNLTKSAFVRNMFIVFMSLKMSIKI